MRITIEPTAEQHGTGASCQHAVSLELPHDEVRIDDVIRLCGWALKAYGYDAQQVDMRLEGE